MFWVVTLFVIRHREAAKKSYGNYLYYAFYPSPPSPHLNGTNIIIFFLRLP